MADDAADRIRAFAAEAVSAARLPAGAGRLVAVGWATVETDRAIGELADALGIAATSFRAGPVGPPRSGRPASSWMCHSPATSPWPFSSRRPKDASPPALARWDEGPLVAWYAAADPGDGPAADVPGIARSRSARNAWSAGDPLTGPHRLLVVDGPGTIRA